MPIDFDALKASPRILIEAALKPVAGTRIQPTGFPDLGPATYDAPPTTDEQKRDFPKGVPTLLVESAQSMANRLEAVCWDDRANELVPELAGLPYVRVKLAGLGDGTDTTTSIQEFHRLNSPYIMSALNADGKAFADVIKPELGMKPTTAAGKKSPKKGKEESPTGDDDPAAEGGEKAASNEVAGVVNLRKLATVCFKYDPNSLVHGLFLEKIAGRLRHPRAVSGFIEASGVGRADSGGVKFDRVFPDKAQLTEITGIAGKKGSEAGYLNVPFHRTEFTARNITAYFTLDLAQIRGYGLPDQAGKLLIALSLWKVRQFLNSTMRLRAACELELIDGENSIHSMRPPKFVLPEATDLAAEVMGLIAACKPHFANPTVTELTWSPEAAKKAIEAKKAKKTKDEE